MKSKHLFAIVAITLFLLAFGLVAFTPKPAEEEKTLMIRATQIALGGANRSFIRVYRGGGEIEKIQLQKWSLDNEETNYDLILTTVQKYEQEGYRLQTSSEVMYGTNGFVNTFLLTKP